MPTPPTSQDDEHYRALSVAFLTYIAKAFGLIKDIKPTGDIGQWLPFALTAHVVQLGRAIHSLVELGYADEGIPIGRQMMSATMNQLFIVSSGNPSGWGLRYWLQIGDLEHRLFERELRKARFDESKLTQMHSQANANREADIRDFEATGNVLPEKLVDPGRRQPRRDTWTGLSDKALADRLGLFDWYDGEYNYLSTVTHAQAVSVLPIAQGLRDGHLPAAGPHFRSPLAAIGVAVTALHYSVMATLKHYGLVALSNQADRAKTQMEGAIDRYRNATGITQFVSDAFGSPRPR